MKPTLTFLHTVIKSQVLNVLGRSQNPKTQTIMRNKTTPKVNRVAPETTTTPTTRQKRISSVQQDFDDILNAVRKSHSWSKWAILTFVLFFVISSIVFGIVVTVSADSKRYDSYSFILLEIWYRLFTFSVDFVSIRALVILVTNRATFKKKRPNTVLSLVMGRQKQIRMLEKKLIIRLITIRLIT